jgi:hypothetical protein
MGATWAEASKEVKTVGDTEHRATLRSGGFQKT